MRELSRIRDSEIKNNIYKYIIQQRVKSELCSGES